MSWPGRHKICWKGLMLFGRLGILMAADIVNIFIPSCQYFYFQYRRTFMRPTMNKLLPMCVWGCVSVSLSLLRSCLNYGNMPKICFSLWAISSPIAFRWFMAFIGQVLCLFVVHCFGQFFVGYELLISPCYIHNTIYIYTFFLFMQIYVAFFPLVPHGATHLFNGLFFYFLIKK